MTFYVVRPLGPWLDAVTPADARRSRWTFKAKWSDTLQLLEDEVYRLDGRNVAMQLDVREQDIRVDGGIRSNAKPIDFPGVRISFDSSYGPLTYATDTHELWQHNVRAIALSLQALRAVDRYGVSRRGEQYTGWKALPAGTGAAATHMTRDSALRIISDWYDSDAWLHLPPATVVRVIRARTHPDRHDGDRDRWNEAEQALQVLNLS